MLFFFRLTINTTATTIIPTIITADVDATIKVNPVVDSVLHMYKPLLKTTIVATLWNNLSCKLKVMAPLHFIYYSQCSHMCQTKVNVLTCEYIDF